MSDRKTQIINFADLQPLLPEAEPSPLDLNLAVNFLGSWQLIYQRESKSAQLPGLTLAVVSELVAMQQEDIAKYLFIRAGALASNIDAAISADELLNSIDAFLQRLFAKLVSLGLILQVDIFYTVTPEVLSLLLANDNVPDAN